MRPSFLETMIFHRFSLGSQGHWSAVWNLCCYVASHLGLWADTPIDEQKRAFFHGQLTPPRPRLSGVVPEATPGILDVVLKCFFPVSLPIPFGQLTICY